MRPLAASLVLAPLILACPAEPAPEPEEVCEPGDTKLCYCAGALEGAQVCRSDGSGWMRCDCTPPGDAGLADAVGADAAAVDGAGRDAFVGDSAAMDLAQMCEPFAVTCVDAQTLATCNGSGTALLEEACPGGQVCLVDACVPALCVPNAHFCGADGERKLCSGDGLSFESDPCDSGLGCSGAGECVAQICEPLSVLCVNEGSRDVQRCNLAGTAYHDDMCGANEVCYSDQCQRVICTPGEHFCLDAQTSAVCNDTGTGTISEVGCDPASGAACDPTTGLCASACQVATSTKSNLGCEYRFAVTDNLGNDTSACEPPAGIDLFPAAVVIANTNNHVVTVTLRDASGAVLHLPPAQQVQELPQPSGFGGCATAHTPALSATVDSKILVGSTVATVLNSQAVDALEVPPGATAQLLIVSPTLRGSRQVRESYQLSTSLPVSASLFNPICCNFAYSNDASLLIPTHAWRQAYMLASAPHLGGSFLDEGLAAGLAIVAAQDGTSVVVRLRPGQSASQLKVENNVPAFSGSELRTELNAGEVLQLETAYDETGRADVTGMLAAANKPIGVFGFHRCTYVPQDQAACDHVEEMLLPVETWGTDYIAAMPRLRNQDLASSTNQERLYYRIVSAANTNRVQVQPIPGDLVQPHDDATTSCPVATDGSFVLDEGQFCELGSRDSFSISADEPILVVALFVGQDATGLTGTGTHAGDPSMVQLVPVGQYQREYAFLTPDTFYADYVTITYETGSIIELDGAQIDAALLGPYGDNELVEAPGEISGSGYAVMTLKLARGAHAVRSLSSVNPDLEGAPFGIMSYGYDDYVSYAFPGGSGLAQTSTYPNLPAFP